MNGNSVQTDGRNAAKHLGSINAAILRRLAISIHPISARVAQMVVFGKYMEGVLRWRDDSTKRGPQDRERINVNERYELDYWSKELKVSPEKLKEAVAKVGVMAKDVRKHLGK